jgi:hypothetical protein
MYIRNKKTSLKRHPETGTHERGNNKPTLVDYPMRLNYTHASKHIHMYVHT